RADGRVPSRLPACRAAPRGHRLVELPAQAAVAVRVPRDVRDAAAGLGRVAVAARESDGPADALIAPPEPPDVHVMTFNIRRAADGMLHRRADRWSWRAPAVQQLLASERPTLIGLQEALPRVMPLVREAL